MSEYKYDLEKNIATITASVLPDGALRARDTDEKKAKFPAIDFEVEMDLSLVNPNKIEIPEAVLATALGAWFILWRPQVKNACGDGSFEEKYNKLKELAKKTYSYKPSEKSEQIGEKTSVKRLQGLIEKKTEMLKNFSEKYKPSLDNLMMFVAMPASTKAEFTEFETALVAFCQAIEKNKK